MSNVLRILLIIVSIFTLMNMMKKIRKSRMQIEYSIFWVVFLGILIIIAIFPQIVYSIAEFIGIKSPVNVVFLIIIFILLLRSFCLSLEVSQLEYKIQELAQEIALQEYENCKKKSNE